MGLAKIIEVVSEGKTVEEAVQNVVTHASKTVRGIRGVDIVHFHAVVEKDKIVKYRVDAKVAFVLEHT